MQALAYFITWTTYGTWLPGDKRGWVKAGMQGIQAPDSELEHEARKLMAENEARLTAT